MLLYLQKFNKLPKELRDKASAPAVMLAIEGLEKRYSVNLAAVIMKIMVKEADVNKLAEYFVQELKLDKIKAEQLEKDLKEKVLFGVADYLGMTLDDSNKQAKDVQAPHLMPAQEVKPVLSTQKSDFLFLDEDEEEIKELVKQTGKNTETALSDNEIEKQLDNTLARAQINFGSEELVARFRKILKIYIRGIRDKIGTKQTLIKPMEVGGLGFDQESAEQVLKIIDSNKTGQDPDAALLKTIKTPESKNEKVTMPEESRLASLGQSGVRDVDYDLSSLPSKKVPEVKKSATKLDTSHELAPPPPKLYSDSPASPALTRSGPLPNTEQDKQASSPLRSSSAFFQMKEKSSIAGIGHQAKKPEAEIKEEQEIKTKSVHGIKQIDDRRVDETTGKIKMEDVKVKFKPKIMGPIDELRYMDLISFRRLEKEPVEIIAKVKEKISLLEEEDYAKRFKSIKAWRTSPVNKLYLEMGQASIGKNKPIDVIIEERKMAGKEALNGKEFEAITDLNRDLRF